MSHEELIIRIELRTSYSIVNILQNNQIKIFEDEFDNKLISFVSFEKQNNDIETKIPKIEIETLKKFLSFFPEIVSSLILLN